MAIPEEENPQFHMGAKPGPISHPESFREKHDLEPPDQTTLEAFGQEPDTVDEAVEQLLENGDIAGWSDIRVAE
jgi:DNA (cytosine-5)-methyltransferase 1